MSNRNENAAKQLAAAAKERRKKVNLDGDYIIYDPNSLNEKIFNIFREHRTFTCLTIGILGITCCSIVYLSLLRK